MTATRSLRSYVAMNRASLLRWCEGKWKDHNPLPHESAPREPPPPPLDLTQLASQSFLSEPFSWSLSLTAEEDPRLGHDWWAVKASRGNGGKDVWIVHQDNYLTVIPSLPIGEEYVMQRSASSPSPLCRDLRLPPLADMSRIRCFGIRKSFISAATLLSSATSPASSSKSLLFFPLHRTMMGRVLQLLWMTHNT
jgi:hypothetical protein